MIKPLSSQQPTPQRIERATSSVDAKSIQEAPRGMMARDSIQKVAEAKLDHRNVFAVLGAGDVHDFLRQGTLAPGRAFFSLDMPILPPSGAPYVLQLSEDGKKALFNSDPGLVDVLVEGTSPPFPNKAPIKLDSHVEELLLSSEHKDWLLGIYGDMAAHGEAPKEIAGKPFTDFFEQHVRATEDVRGDIELKNFRKHIPGFTRLSTTEQRVRASLGGQLAETWPRAIPGDVRRQMANSMIRHKSFDRGAPGAGLKVAGEIKEFFHGTTSGKLISRIGFRGQPELLFKQLPEGMQKLLTTKLGVKFASAYGSGVYFGNASVAGSYAVSKLDGMTKEVHVVSGLVALGKTATKDFAEAADAEKAFAAAADAHTRVVLGADPNGSYYVTRDPKRFTVKGLTTLDPKRTDGLMRYFPQILKAHAEGPYQIGNLVDRLPAAASRRALEEARKAGDPSTVKHATLLLARRGDTGALASSLKLLESVGTPKEFESFSAPLMKVITSLGPGHAERTGPVADALLKAGLRVFPEQSFGNPIDNLANDMFSALGEEIRPMVETLGIKLGTSVPTEGVLDRAKKAASKALKRLV